MRAFAQQPLALAQGFADQIEFAVFQVAQAAVDDAGGTAGDAAGEVVLLDQQRAFAGTGAFPGDGNSVDAAADHDEVEVLAVERGAGFDGKGHFARGLVLKVRLF
jgi:hypothetical protein